MLFHEEKSTNRKHKNQNSTLCAHATNRQKSHGIQLTIAVCLLPTQQQQQQGRQDERSIFYLDNTLSESIYSYE